MPRISAESSWSSRKFSWLAISSPLCLRLAFLDHERGVVSAKSKRVGQGDVDARLTRLVRHVVEVTFGVRIVEVDRRRKQSAIEGEHAGRGLDRAGGAEQVAMHRLGRADGQLEGVVAENRLDRLRLRDIAELGRRAVGVDVADRLGI